MQRKITIKLTPHPSPLLFEEREKKVLLSVIPSPFSRERIKVRVDKEEIGRCPILISIFLSQGRERR